VMAYFAVKKEVAPGGVGTVVVISKKVFCFYQ
jgi:hypothetical protein